MGTILQQVKYLEFPSQSKSSHFLSFVCFVPQSVEHLHQSSYDDQDMNLNSQLNDYFLLGIQHPSHHLQMAVHVQKLIHINYHFIHQQGL